MASGSTNLQKDRCYVLVLVLKENLSNKKITADTWKWCPKGDSELREIELGVTGQGLNRIPKNEKSIGLFISIMGSLNSCK